MGFFRLCRSRSPIHQRRFLRFSLLSLAFLAFLPSLSFLWLVSFYLFSLAFFASLSLLSLAFLSVLFALSLFVFTSFVLLSHSFSVSLSLFSLSFPAFSLSCCLFLCLSCLLFRSFLFLVFSFSAFLLPFPCCLVPCVLLFFFFLLLNTIVQSTVPAPGRSDLPNLPSVFDDFLKQSTCYSETRLCKARCPHPGEVVYLTYLSLLWFLLIVLSILRFRCFLLSCLFPYQCCDGPFPFSSSRAAFASPSAVWLNSL